MRVVLVLLFSLIAIGAAHAQIRAVPPADYRPLKAQAVPTMRLPSTAPTRATVLAAATEQEASALNTARGAATKAMNIGFPRALPDPDRVIEGNKLAWTLLTDGGYVARFSFTSPAAAGLRVLLRAPAAPAAIVARWQSLSGKQQVFPARSISAAPGEGLWSPVIEGDTAVLEIEVPAGIDPGALRIDVPLISHLLVAGPDVRKKVEDIGKSQPCEIDLACVSNPSQALKDAARAVAKLVYTKAGLTGLCTGTLLNTSDQSFVPYIYTANHCISDPATAATLNTYWFFEASLCASAAVPNYVLVDGGAQLSSTDLDLDYTLLRMNSNPPANARFAAWRAEPVFAGTPVVTLHHPAGDLKKLSQGTAQRYGSFGGLGSFLRVLWTDGTTEGGSSGAGLFTFNPSGYYELRGGLSGGDATCADRGVPDHFSRLDVAYVKLTPFLAPGTPALPHTGEYALEYYNVNLDHYFITAGPGEMLNIESGGAGPGWYLTGYAFPIYSGEVLPAIAIPTCRFYGTPGLGPNSHFYTVVAQECEAVKHDPGWTYEGLAFYIAAPISGATCPNGFIPVYRNYDNRFAANDSNHRFTTDPGAYQFMINQGWLAEGVVMCSPNAS